jgi:hypothetical protein
MARYSVRVVRTALMAANVVVEASNEEEAREAAVELASSGEDIEWSDEETLELEASDVVVTPKAMVRLLLLEIEDIKSAVDLGRTVYCDSKSYTVIKKGGEYFITYHGGGMIGLHGEEGTEYERVLNGKLFWIERSK